MPKTLPSLLRLIGEGFVDDEYATDGNHLRWMFHPALGFSRYPFCLERRPSVATKRGQAGVDVRSENLRDVGDGQYRVVRGDVTVTREDMYVGFGGFIPLVSGLPPVDIRFGGAPEPYAAWVRVHIQLTDVSHATVEAYHDSAGDVRLVDRASAHFRPFTLPPHRFPRVVTASRMGRSARQLMSVLQEPDSGKAPPITRDRDLRRVYDVLVEHDPVRYRHVNAAFLREVAALRADSGIAFDDLWKYLPRTRMVHLDVFGDRIDFVRVSGRGGVVLGVDWALAESLMEAKWERVDCYSALTDEPDYVERNIDHLPPGPDIRQGTENRLSDLIPRGAEPMDDPQVPPSRPPTLAERMSRYGRPWLERLEGWLQKVLADTLDGTLHGSEVTIDEPLTEFGQKPGDGIPTLPSGVPAIDQQTQTIRPYGMLLAASMAFPNAQLMGLAAIDLPRATQATDRWDYRVTGHWRAVDLESYANKLRKDLERAREAVGEASPADVGEAITNLIRAFGEYVSGIALISALINTADSGLVELSAYTGGLSLTEKSRFGAPGLLDVSFEELASPGDVMTGPRRRDTAVAHLEWPIASRASQIERHMPMLATLARRPQGDPQPFSRVLNPVDQDFGVVSGVIPLDVDADDDGIATADYFDRAVESGVLYRYGVSQSDLFGRWSSFTERDFRWTYDIPPPPPVGVQATLDEVGTPAALRLTVEFKWPTDLYPGDEHRFSVYMSRSPLEPASVHDPSVWAGHGMRRTDGSGAGSFEFAGSFVGNTNHDGMPVAVAFSDSTETDPAGVTKTYRAYRVRFRGVQLARVDELARCFVGVQAHDASGIDGDEVAGPARADHYDPRPPPPPEWPPAPLRSSIADADGFSTFELSWSATPQATYEVFRVGERDLVAHLQNEGVTLTGYDRDDDSNFRAAALKALAADQVARRAFARRSELGTGVGSFADQLPGYASTLFIYVVLSRSPSGVASPWPTSAGAFLAVEVPRAPVPDRPSALSARWEPAVGPGVQPLGSGDRVEITIAQPPEESAEVVAYEVYRTKSAEKAKDTSTMRLLHRLDAPVFQGAEGEVAATTYIDPYIEPWSTYYYRVVARGPGSQNGVGMRSEPSTPIKLTTLGSAEPSAPVIDSALRDLDGSVLVSFSAEAFTTPAGDFLFDVLTRKVPDHLRRHVTVWARDARVDVDTFQVTFVDADVPPGSEVHVRVRSPLGRSAESMGLPLPPA